MDPYSEAHLFVAAIRVLKFQKQSPPDIADVSSMLELSVEAALASCRKLEKLNIIEIAEDPFSIKLSVADHLEIENLEREDKGQDNLSKELEAFMQKKKDMDKKVEAIQADLQKKKQDLHNDIEAKLRREMDKMKKG